MPNHLLTQFNLHQRLYNNVLDVFIEAETNRRPFGDKNINHVKPIISMQSKTATFIQNRQVWANSPVKNVERTMDFYSSLGFIIKGDRNNEQLISFFVGEDDFIVHFFREERFEQSSAGKAANLKEGNEVMFTIGANSREEVVTWAEQVKDAGGSVFFNPAEIGQNGWYGCGFANPEGHKWNVFYNGK